MKLLAFSILLSAFSCHSSKNAVAPVEITPEGVKILKDSMPVCISVLVETFKSEAVTNPPRKIFSYKYNGKVVYYVPAICCDMYSDLYNDSCRVMGHPDGGFTGKGDGTLKDFQSEKTEEKLLWEDPRTK